MTTDFHISYRVEREGVPVFEISFHWFCDLLYFTASVLPCTDELTSVSKFIEYEVDLGRLRS